MDNSVYNARARKANEDLLKVVSVLKDPHGPWEVVRPARWWNPLNGTHVETGYSYGEGRVRIYEQGGRKPTSEHCLRGRSTDLDGLRERFALVD